jgi:hypothetical protein
MVEVSVRISRTPPSEWQDSFNYPSGHSTLGDGAPVLKGTTVSIGVNDGQEKDGIAAIDERLARANQEYERDVLPSMRQQEAQEKRRAETENQRLEAARKRLKDL